MLLLDTNFISALVAETQRRQAGPATAFLRVHPGQKTIVSLITVGEYLEYAGAPPVPRPSFARVRSSA